MYAQIFTFFIASLIVLNLSRLGLVCWQFERVKKYRLAPLFIGGLRIDLATLGKLVIPSLLFAPWLDGNLLAQQINAVWLCVASLCLLIPEVASAQFIMEYDTRPNRLFVDYLKHPQEVVGMLWKGFKTIVIIGTLGVVLLMWGALYLFKAPAASLGSTSLLWQIVEFLVSAAVVTLMIRGTLQHRPINPSTVAYCGDSMVNTLPLNSLYSVYYAVYSIKNERSAKDAYENMDEDKVYQLVNQAAGITPEQNELNIPSWHFQTASQTYQRPKNIVLIVQESLGAQYIGGLGGQNLSPCFDKLMQEGWAFHRCYATGTRSVRGLEAVSSGFAPTLSDAVLRLTKSQSRFFTLAQLLNPLGYRSSFIYGGESHFDNMRSYFLGNGFKELYDRESFTNPAFEGTWGVSDEDMFAKLHEVLMDDLETPKLSLAFTVTNHTPWEYPAGRIEPVGEPASVENSVRYVDWCIGQFFEKAKQSPYWHNTLFLIVADHDSRVWGDTLVPLRHFHIPALILGAGVEPKADNRIVSQLDLPVTLLSLAGVSASHPMIGQDLTHADAGGRAMMQYNDNYGFLQGDILTVLQPKLPPQQLRYEAPATYVPLESDIALQELARAHAIWPTLMYEKGLYTLPELHSRK
ncbi:LTA synthase family protein [Pelistega europaea]|uniref:Sulfatase-like hydrolase/transferase n=1 Tax=Pelistega europaea TaxID=106147 RepID=A0A7Y4LAF9_9BURK|nr:LTA synthase family protein [Pelistega europaea]NOL49990.1 sulfatase-like hydrolase/transferase [Pelistega europaea]